MPPKPKDDVSEPEALEEELGAEDTKEERAEEEEEPQDLPRSAARKPDDSEEELWIPKSRFDQINTRMKKAERELSELATKTKKAERERLERAQEFRTLYETALADLERITPQAEAYEEYRLAIEEMVEALVAKVPKGRRSLVPDQLEPLAKLRWLNANQNLLGKIQPRDIGTGHHIIDEEGGDGSEVELSPEEKTFAKAFNMTPEDYLKYKSEND